MTSFSASLRNILLPVGAEDVAKVFDRFQDVGTGSVGLKCFELIGEILTVGDERYNLHLNQPDVVLGEALAPRCSRDVTVEAYDEGHLGEFKPPPRTESTQP